MTSLTIRLAALTALVCTLAAAGGSLRAQSAWMPLPANIRVVIGSGGQVNAISGREIQGSVSPFGAGLTLGDSFNLESNVWTTLVPTTPTGVGAETLRLISADLAITPNPFTERTSISYRAQSSGTARLAIYTILGERVRVLEIAQVAGERTSFDWDGRDDRGARVPQGSYLLLLNLPATDRGRDHARVVLRRVR